MPFWMGAMGSHDDSSHQGSAKRDTASGLAGLDVGGDVLGPGANIELTRDGNGDISIIERTSGESVAVMRRTGANAYSLYNNTVAGAKRIQDSSMKDVNSGIAAFDASGNLLVKNDTILITRNVSNEIIIAERTASEQAFKLKRTSANNYTPYVIIDSADRIIAFLDTNGDIPHLRPKAASANLRHSHDAVASTTNATYTKLKTILFAYGISGTLRLAFDANRPDAGETHKVRIYKNGAAIGTERTVAAVAPAWDTFSEDINVGILDPGTTIELWAYNLNLTNTQVRNFRVSYDNAADTILVTGVWTS